MSAPYAHLPEHLRAILAGSVKLAPSMPPVQSRATPRAQRHAQQDARTRVDATQWEDIDAHECTDDELHGATITPGEF